MHVQAHFDYAYSVWYPNLNKKFKTKLQTLQNKYVRFCLQLDHRAHLGKTEFRKINWLPDAYRFRQCFAANAFEFFDDRCPSYMKDIPNKTLVFITADAFFSNFIYYLFIGHLPYLSLPILFKGHSGNKAT